MAQPPLAPDPLEDELVKAVSEDTGLKPELARTIVRPIVVRLRMQHGGRNLYVKAPRQKRVYPVKEIVAFYKRTNDVDRTCREFSISRRTLFRILSQVV